MRKLSDQDTKLNLTIKIIFLSFISITLILNIFFESIIPMVIKNDSILNNIQLFPFMMLAFAFLCFLLRYRHSLCQFIEKHFYALMIASALIVFALQLYLIRSIYFQTGWDVKTVVDSARMVSNGQAVSENEEYYLYLQHYPNNVFIIWIFSKIMKAASLFGFEERYAVCVIVGAFLTILSGIFTALCVRKITNSKSAAFLSWIIFIPLMALSPWICIPYSDIYSMPFIATALFLYVCILKENKKAPVKWLFLYLLLFLGSLIKPTTYILLIAIIMIEIIRLIKSKIKISYLRNRIFAGIMIIPALAASLTFNKISFNAVDLEGQDEKALSYVHYLMMGLNSDKSGIFSVNDVLYSFSIESSAERKEANWAVVKSRLKNFGFIGLLKHLSAKNLLNYNIGNFCWGAEGNFFIKRFELTDSKAAVYLRSMFTEGGSRQWKLHATFMQFIWMCLLMSLFMHFIKPKSRSAFYTDAESTVYLMILGISIFLLLFEARSRYLIPYVPVFCIAFALAIKKASDRMPVRS